MSQIIGGLVRLPLAHTHKISDVINLESELNSKENAFSKNTAFNKDFGNSSGTVCEGNDPRLSDERVPLPHDHKISDVINLESELNSKAENSDLQNHIGNNLNPHSVTKVQIGLGNVLNTEQVPTSEKGVANGIPVLDSTGKIPLGQLPDVARLRTYVVTTIAERDALTPLSGEKSFVTDTGQSFIYDGSTWMLQADADWENIDLQWVNIVGKPISSVSSIDDAVIKRHEHSNKSIIDAITAAGSGQIITSIERNKLNGIEEGATTDQTKSEIDALGINATELGGFSDTDFIKQTEKNIGNGVAGLDSNARILEAQLPEIIDGGSA